MDQSYLYDAEGLRVKKSEGLVTTGTGYNVDAWSAQVTSAVDGVLPTAGPSMYRITVTTDAINEDHFTNENIVLEDGLNIPLSIGSYLEYDIRAAQTTNLRASVQLQYYDPSTQHFTYSWYREYKDQQGRSNVWNTDLNSVYVNQWYHRVFPLNSLAGVVIKKVVFMTNDNPTGAETDVFYCDEVRINGIDIGKANGAASAPAAFYENFNDGNIDDGVPVDWYTTSSTYWNATGGTLNRTANSSAQCSNPQHQFYDFEADFDVIITNYGSSQGNWIAFAFRKTNYSDWYNTSGYMVYYRRNGELELYSASGGILNQNDFTGKPLNVWRHLKIVTTGANIKVYIDGELELEHNDGTYTGQYFGFNTLGVQASFDNFSINANPFKNEIFYVRDIDGEVLSEYDGGGNLLAEYVSANGQQIAKINPTGTVDLYLNDHLGSARAMVDSGWSANYYPFGEIASQTGSDEDTRYDFTGKERDRGTALLYFGARYYDPEIGRFISVDRFADKYPSLTPYQYAANNPLLFIDANGDTIDYSGLTEEQRKYFDELVVNLSKDKRFAEVWNTLATSTAIYKIAVNESQEAFAQYGPNTEETGSGGTLSFREITPSGIEGTTAHEVYHAFQHDQNYPPRSVGKEIEASLFSDAVT